MLHPRPRALSDLPIRSCRPAACCWSPNGCNVSPLYRFHAPAGVQEAEPTPTSEWPQNHASAQLCRPALSTPRRPCCKVARRPAGDREGRRMALVSDQLGPCSLRRTPLVVPVYDVRSVWFIELSELQARTLRRRPRASPPICSEDRRLLCPRPRGQAAIRS